MALSFPSSPSIGQQSTQNGIVYSWTGTVWQKTATPGTINSVNISDFNSSVSGVLDTYTKPLKSSYIISTLFN